MANPFPVLQGAILKTPLEIYLTASRFFPSTVVKIVRLQPELCITIQLNTRSIPLNITRAVKRADLDLALALLLARCSPQASAPIVLPALDQTAVPLEQGVQFEREMCPSCPEVIKRFLVDTANVDNQRDIEALGLGPDDVMPLDQPTFQETIIFFLEALKTYSAGDPLLIKFQRLYPAPFLERVGAEAKEQEARGTRRRDPCREMQEFLTRHVLGQPFAVKTLAQVPITEGRNMAALFVGPPGVGKTELAKAVAIYKKVILTRFEMQTYCHESDVSTFFGSASGFVGSTSKPHLALELDKAKDKKTTHEGIIIRDHVLLFDEIEKAHPTVRAALLTLLDEGRFIARFTSAEGNTSITYILQGCYMFCTSNACQGAIVRASQAGLSAQAIVTVFQGANAFVADDTRYSPELLRRLTIVPFIPISVEDFKKLLRSKIDAFCRAFVRKTGCQSINFIWDPSDFLIIALCDKFYGGGVALSNIEKVHIRRLEGFIEAKKPHWGELSDTTLYIAKTVERGPIMLKVTFKSKFSGIEQTREECIIDCWD